MSINILFSNRIQGFVHFETRYTQCNRIEEELKDHRFQKAKINTHGFLVFTVVGRAKRKRRFEPPQREGAKPSFWRNKWRFSLFFSPSLSSFPTFLMDGGKGWCPPPPPEDPSMGPLKAPKGAILGGAGERRPRHARYSSTFFFCNFYFCSSLNPKSRSSAEYYFFH